MPSDITRATQFLKSIDLTGTKRSTRTVADELRRSVPPTDRGEEPTAAEHLFLWPAKIGRPYPPAGHLLAAVGEHAPIRRFWTIGGAAIDARDVPAPCLVELASGLFAALTVLPRFDASIQLDARGVSSLSYRPGNSPEGMPTAADAAIARLTLGALRANDAADLAGRIRAFEHVDPVVGVISAYLYDSIGDTDSIRRLAYYYVENDQSIPYDVALLALLQGERDGVGLRARIPAVPARAPRTPTEAVQDWTHAATPAATGVVGGLWPWMRQGWTFLDDPEESGSTLSLPGLIELMPHLRPARFATFDAAGGQALAHLLGLLPVATGGR